MTASAVAGAWQSLVGTPWESMNCVAAVREVFRLAGVDLPPGALTRAHASSWNRVPKPDRLLDVIASDPKGLGCESHISILVRLTPRRLALSSHIGGGVSTVAPWAIQNVVAVYRWGGVE